MELKIFVTIIVLTATLVILYFFIKKDQTDSKTNQKTSDSVTKKTMDKDDIAWEALPEEFVVFDLETTGLKNQVPVDIVEISAVKVVKDTFRESGRTKTFSAIVRPWRGGINPEAAAINQITQQMIDEEGKEISSTIREFVEFVGDSLLVAYNVSFDRWFLKRELQDQGISKHYKYECALELARVAFPDLKNHKLTTVADHMGINTQGAHRALQDCVMALQVYVWSKTKIEAMKSVENAVISFKERLKSNPELVGKSVVFTGTLELMPRPEAEKLVTLAGMIVRTSLSKKTDLVVAGKKPGKKLEQALALNKVPLTEIEFWQLLQPEIPEACESNQDKS